MSETQTKDVSWVKPVPQKLMDEPGIAFRIDRDGYTAFLYATGYNEFEVAHRHFNEDEWRREPIAKTSLLGSVARFSHCEGIVEMPNLDDVEVTRDDAFA